MEGFVILVQSQLWIHIDHAVLHQLILAELYVNDMLFRQIQL